MKNFSRKILLAFLSVLIASNANAATLVCNGTVTELAYHAPGILFVRLSGMNTMVGICSTDVNWNPPGSVSGITTPAACKTIYATLLVAKQAGSLISGMYLDSDVMPASCSAIPTFTHANLRFLHAL